MAPSPFQPTRTPLDENLATLMRRLGRNAQNLPASLTFSVPAPDTETPEARQSLAARYNFAGLIGCCLRAQDPKWSRVDECSTEAMEEFRSSGEIRRTFESFGGCQFYCMKRDGHHELTIAHKLLPAWERDRGGWERSADYLAYVRGMLAAVRHFDTLGFTEGRDYQLHARS